MKFALVGYRAMGTSLMTIVDESRNRLSRRLRPKGQVSGIPWSLLMPILDPSQTFVYKLFASILKLAL